MKKITARPAVLNYHHFALIIQHILKYNKSPAGRWLEPAPCRKSKQSEAIVVQCNLSSRSIITWIV